ncbi:hypothetical protein OG233_13870 [Streptomyces sp. NBC_01218]|uniref:hypothetical protein n=1 Tax=unclassified Streptomyces TaxID=2593676 RepID=UPI0023B9E794|nr:MULTISPECIES: hypothetical protein [unclassified Streptomyces]WEH40483.1 hypothetical protein PZB77_13720 [Streptomyces sp. AM 2-1-1]WSQ52176.1 hypothetical protein OG233_13870 [Streptomyces sp. NBC_01218]
MESGPAVLAGSVFAVFGVALLLWTGARTVRRAPVAHGVSPVPAAVLSTVFGVLFLVLGVWVLTGI